MRIFRLLRPHSYDLVHNSTVPNQNSEVNQLTPECEHLLASSSREDSETVQTMAASETVQTMAASETVQTMAASEHSLNGGRDEMRVELPPPKPDMSAPPPYEEVELNTPQLEVDNVSYDQSVALQPPSYEEVQRQKALEAGEDPLHITDTSGSSMQVVRISSLGGLDPQTAEIAEEQLLGTDLMFFVAFTAAFLFNLIGIVLLLCLCHTVAGRTGALAGFGLSLAKWVVIFRHSTDLVADSNSWLLWLIMILGLLICVRAILQYISAKRDWQHLPHNSRHRFFLFY